MAVPVGTQSLLGEASLDFDAIASEEARRPEVVRQEILSRQAASRRREDECWL